MPWGNLDVRSEHEWEGFEQAIVWHKPKRIPWEQLIDQATAGKRITLRSDPVLHAALTEVARQRGVSLNELILAALREWLSAMQRRHEV
jgi:hypothetical protein